MAKDREKLRKAFGKSGDVNPELAEMFGQAYLDHPEDTSGARIMPELEKVSEKTGGQFHEVSKLLERALEVAPTISCEEHQETLLRHLKDYLGLEDSPISHEEGFATTKHASACPNQKCRKLNTISTWDSVLTPNQMREAHGEEIVNWVIG